jgi:hypothetical protein
LVNHETKAGGTRHLLNLSGKTTGPRSWSPNIL